MTAVYELGDERLPKTFWKNVEVDERTGCWQWMGYRDQDGYANFHTTRFPTKRAARISFMALRGEIPEGMTVQHDCYNTSCVSPEEGHAWRLLSSVDNVRHTAVNNLTAITHCPHGHEYTEANSFYFPSNPIRQCRECFRQRSAAFGDKRRQKEGRQWGVTKNGVLQSGRCRNGHGRDVITRLADGAYHCEECGGWE